MSAISMSSPTSAATLLRRVLLLDAGTCLATGLLLLAGAGLLEPLLAIPAGFQRATGVVLLAFGLFVLWTSMRPALSPGLVHLVIAANAFWVIDSIAVVAFGLIAPNALGLAFVGLQAMAVAGLAALEALLMRRVMRA